MAKESSGRKRTVGGALAVALLALIGGSSPAGAADWCNQFNVTCMNSAGVRTCMHTRMQLGDVFVSATSTMTVAPATACTLVVLNASMLSLRFTAKQPTAATGTGACAFFGNALSSGTSPFVYECTIDAADGLPIELMEFSVEEEESGTGEQKR